MNKTIKIIDLLNKIANGEEVPKKIRTEDGETYELEFCHDTPTYYDHNEYTLWYDKNFNILNDYVEILDESEEIAELDEEIADYDEFNEYKWDWKEKMIVNKINELVRAVNQIRKEKE